MVPSAPPAAFPSTTDREYVASTATNIVETVSKITKEVGEMFKDVPYVKAFAGIIIRVIEIREDMQMMKNRSQELVDKILRRSKIILDGLLRVAKSPNLEQLKDIEGRLNEYNDLLGKTVVILETSASKGVIDRIINRRSRLDELEKVNRLIDDFNTDFVTDLQIRVQSHLMNICQRTPPSSTPADTVLYKPVLPPPAELMIGRDKEKHVIIDALLNKMPARVAILGGGGIGKTTLALSTLHDLAVIDRYPSRYFVSCEGIPSVSALVGEVANALRIPPANRDEHLIDVILSSFHGNTALCLDNFETIWDNEAIRSDVEEFLSHLNRLPKLSIIITMRGTQRPSRVSWSKILLPSLGRLSDADSKLIFETICGPVDEFVDKLLKAVDGIPLAVTLISALLQEGNETSESLWTRWEQTKTSVVENGGKDRLSNLDRSIYLSVYGPRMQADPNVILMLAVLSILPDGFPYSEVAIDALQRHMPEDNRVRAGLLTLRRVSLVHVDETNTSHRLRMLTPIRHFCEERLQAPEILRGGLISFYTEMLDTFKNFTNSAGHAIIPAELRNMHVVFVLAWKLRMVDELVIRACIQYTEWSLYIGNPVEEIIRLAVEGVVGSPGLLGDCHSTLSYVSLRRYKLDEAQASAEHAIKLHRRAHNIFGEANDVQMLGLVYLRRDKLDEAQAFFERAIELHRQAHSVLGEAKNIQMLGEVYLRRDKLDEAQASFAHAIGLHRQAHNVLDEADNVQMLGVVYLRRDKLDEAQASFERAIKLHQEAHSVLGEAKDILMLGGVCLRRDKLVEAQASFVRAIGLHRQAQDVLGEADDIQMLGDVYLRQNKLDEAQASFERAIRLHRQAHDVLGEANDIQVLGEVYLRRDKLDEAQASFERAIELHRQAQDVLGEARDVQNRGEVYLRRDKLIEAQASFERAIELCRQAHSVLGEANNVQMLGDVYLRRDKLDEAQASFERAIELHRQAHDVLGEANDIQVLGEVHLRRDKLDEAQASLERAMELHRQAHDVLGEAKDIQVLGEVYLRRDKLDEAQSSFERAIELYRQACSVLGEANNVQMLGEVYLRRDKLHEAHASFECALVLHQQAHHVLGEANDVKNLGIVYLRWDKLDEAQASFGRAIELHRQAHSVLGEANDVQMLGELYSQCSKLDDAQASFEHAVDLHRQAQNALGEANSLQSLADLHLQQDNLQEAELCLNHALLIRQQSPPSQKGIVDLLRLLEQLSIRKEQPLKDRLAM